MRLVQPGDIIDKIRYLPADIAAERDEGTGRVFQDIVEQRGAEHLRAHAELGEDDGDRDWVGDIRIPAAALLPAMPGGGDRVRALDHGGAAVVMPGADGS